MKDRQVFAKYMTLLAEVHGKEISKSLMDVYWISLQQYGDTECESAFNRLITTTRFFPKPVDVIEAIQANNPAAQITMNDRATEQIAVVMKQVRELGYYRTPCFDDPVTKRLMTGRWSWRSICSMTTEEHKWWAKEFIEAYQASERVNGNSDMPQIENSNRRLKLLAGGIGGR